LTDVAAPARRGLDREGLLVAGGYAAVLFLVSWLRHRNHWTGFDLAIFDQGAWQISEGRDHISVVERHVMADHFSPVLFVFGWLYRVAATPVWFFAAQALALGATVLPMRGLARVVGQPASRGGLLVVLSAPLLAASVFDFHPSTLAVPFLATTLLFAVGDRPVPAALAAVAAVLCRADLALVVLAMVLVAGRRARWPVAIVGLVAAAASAVVPGRFGETNGWAPHFGHLGSSPVQAVLHPWDVAGQLLSGKSLSVLLLWVAAGGVAIVVRPRWLLALVVAGLPILLSRWLGTELPWYHYGAPMAPIAMGGSLVGLTFVAARTERWAVRLRSLWWLGPVVALALASPLSPSAPEVNRISRVAFEDDGRDVEGAVALVPPDAAVSADQRVLARLSQRERAYLYPIPFAEAESFFAEGSHPDLEQYADDAVDVVIAPAGFEDLVPEDRFEVVQRLRGLVVLERREADGGATR
jgi:uncharacterized membrane protein